MIHRTSSWLKPLSGLSLRSISLPLVLSSLLLVTSCSSLGLPLPSLGGGTNVAANTQIGKNNTQTIGQTNNVAPTVSLRPNARVESIDQSSDSVTNNELPIWVWIIFILLFIVGWVTDTPGTIIRDLVTSSRKRDK